MGDLKGGSVVGSRKTNQKSSSIIALNFKKGISIETFYFPVLDLPMCRQKKETALFVVREDYTHTKKMFLTVR